MEDMSDEEDEMRESIFNRDEDDFSGMGSKGAGGN
jgi:hypothetical protein